MVSKKGYDVLRLIEHGRICYISSEYVEGEMLAEWMKLHADLPKEQLFSLIGNIVKQLGMIHKCRTNPCYQYVNPYSIVVAKEGKTYFLDMKESSNEEQLKFMQKRVVRECFLPENELYYQKASMELDIYGMGKTIQYLLSIACPDPPLNRREEKKFLKIISKCLKYQSNSSYQNVSEVHRQIPRYKEKTKRVYIHKRKLILAGGALIIMAVIVMRNPSNSSKEQQNIKVTNPEDEKENIFSDSREMDEKQRAYMELAAVYILEVEDYQKSLEYLEEIDEEYIPAKYLKVLVEALLGRKVSAKVLEENLQGLEKETPKDDILRYYRCLMRGYEVLDTRESAKEILRLGEICREQPEVKTQEKQEIIGYMASAWEKTGEYERAAYMYEEILTEEEGYEKREEIYKKIITLYEACGQNAMALDTCIQGIEELTDSQDLMLLHIRLLCRDAAIDRGLCAQTIQEYLRRSSEIPEKEEFQKLQREYEIQVEGENVWVGR